MEWIELTPDDITECIVHMIMTGILVWFVPFVVTLQLQAFDQSFAAAVDLKPHLALAVFQ